MITLEADPAAAADTPAWTVISNDRPIGRAWKSQDHYTLQINGVSITEQSIADALERARRYLGDIIEPLPPDDQPYDCRAKEHAVRRVRYLGPVQFEICADPQCAKILAMCEHRKNTWNAEGTTLTCDFCGRDVT